MLIFNEQKRFRAAFYKNTVKAMNVRATIRTMIVLMIRSSDQCL